MRLPWSSRPDRRSWPIVALLAAACEGQGTDAGPAWDQWGQNGRHDGALAVTGQALRTIDLDYVYDPFVTTEVADGAGSLPEHYMTPLTAGDAVTMETKSGTYSTVTYATQTWGVVRFRWVDGALTRQWQVDSDWKAVGGSADFWEPVFHGAIANGYLYVPGAKGTVLKLDEQSGATVSRITPDAGWDESTYTVSPIVADDAGNLYFTVLRLPPPGPAVMRPSDEIAGSNGPSNGWTAPMPSVFYGSDALDSLLVKVDPHDSARLVSLSSLVPDAPKSADPCFTTFSDADLPWPPGPDAAPPTAACGTQRVAVSAAPAVAPDGTIYVVTRAHFNSRYAYLVAVNPDLTPRWDASLRDRFDDGCGVPHSLGGQLEPDGAPGGCSTTPPRRPWWPPTGASSTARTPRTTIRRAI